MILPDRFALASMRCIETRPESVQTRVSYMLAIKSR